MGGGNKQVNIWDSVWALLAKVYTWMLGGLKAGLSSSIVHCPTLKLSRSLVVLPSPSPQGSPLEFWTKLARRGLQSILLQLEMSPAAVELVSCW